MGNDYSDHMDAQTAQYLHAARTYKGIPPEDQLGYTGTLGQLLVDRAATYGDKIYLIYYDEQGNRSELSYNTFRAEAHRMARYMVEGLGLQAGDRIASVGHNHAETVLLYFAAWSVGLTVVPVNVGEDDERVVFITNNAESKVMFARPDYVARMARLRPKFTHIRAMVQVGGDTVEADVDHHLQQEAAAYPAEFVPPTPFDNTQESLIVYTSGTTGAPKGVLLNHYNLIVDARGIMLWHHFDENQRTMCVLPIHHVNGIVVTLITPMVMGGSTVLNRAFSPRHFWERIAAEKVQVASLVPTLLAFLLDAERSNRNFQEYDLSAFRHLICGAGPLTVALAQEFEETFGVRIIHGYGLSETTCYSCFLPVEQSDEEHEKWMRAYGYPAIGIPIEPNEMAIQDLSGNPVPPGVEHKGEIVIRGHNVMQGYFRRPDANQSTFAFQWFRSGDEGFYVEDDQGRPIFFITGRIKELIIRGGVNYSPFEIDEILMNMPGVKAGLAVGFANKYYGEEVGAYIVPEPGATVTEDAVLEYVQARLPFSKRPKVVIFGSEVPVTSTGKYQRLKLAPLFAQYEETQFREK